jgi:hypothetical protein
MPTRKHWILALLTCLAAQTRAEDPALGELHGLLEPLRKHAAGNTYDAPGFWTRNSSGDLLRFAPLALTPAKQHLRGWIERRLAISPQNVGVGALMAELDTGLSHADLFCQKTPREDSPDRCQYEHADWNATGFVYPGIKVDRLGRDLLVVRAGLGIECGADTSAYAYVWRGGRWQRIWQDELPIQDGIPYWPRTIDSVSVSPVDPDSGTRLVMALGNMDWCSSTFYPVYARLWRLSADGANPKLLLDLDERAWLGDEPPLSGYVSLHDALIDFMRPGIDSDGAHEALLHFEIKGDSVRRVDPLARTARGFIEEWLYMEWPQSRNWVATGAGDLSRWHAKFRDHQVHASFVQALRCREKHEWQVTMPMDFKDGHSETYYFRVRRTGERFEMLDIGTIDNADCDDPADENSQRDRLAMQTINSPSRPPPDAPRSGSD